MILQRDATSLMVRSTYCIDVQALQCLRGQRIEGDNIILDARSVRLYTHYSVSCTTRSRGTEAESAQQIRQIVERIGDRSADGLQ